MIKTFKSKVLRDFWQTGKSRKIAADLRGNITIILSVLDVAESKNDLNLIFMDCGDSSQHGTRFTSMARGV